MKRVLFVDDEEHLLRALRNNLYLQRKHWQMVYVASGEAALEELAKEPFDVIVSDLRMPGMDGATLLHHVKERWPRVARIVLSGQAEPDALERARRLADAVLSKPCDIEVLKASIGDAVAK